jgi:hypothetical protein
MLLTDNQGKIQPTGYIELDKDDTSRDDTNSPDSPIFTDSSESSD